MYETKYQAAMKTVNALKDGIWKIYNKIGCNTPANREMLGEEGVTEQNMMQYLGIIEQRTNEILQMYAAGPPAHSSPLVSTPPLVSSLLISSPRLISSPLLPSPPLLSSPLLSSPLLSSPFLSSLLLSSLLLSFLATSHSLPLTQETSVQNAVDDVAWRAIFACPWFVIFRHVMGCHISQETRVQSV